MKYQVGHTCNSTLITAWYRRSHTGSDACIPSHRKHICMTFFIHWPCMDQTLTYKLYVISEAYLVEWMMLKRRTMHACIPGPAVGQEPTNSTSRKGGAGVAAQSLYRLVSVPDPRHILYESIRCYMACMHGSAWGQWVVLAWHALHGAWKNYLVPRPTLT